jgi:hypothetical protein
MPQPTHSSVSSPQATSDIRPSKATHSPKLRAIADGDYSQIAAITAAHGFPPSIWSYEQWRHLWINNPAYLRFGENLPRGWVLEAEGRIVGHIGDLPLLYEFEGRQLLVSNGYGYALEPQYRGYALFLAEQYWNQRLPDVVSGYQTNSDGFRMHAELGIRPIPLGTWDPKHFWITRRREFMAEWLRYKKLPAAELLAYPAAVALTTKDAWNRMLLRIHARQETRIQISTDFDGRFDTFWNDLRARYPHKLLAVRALATLKWRFHFALHQRRLWIATFSEGGCLRAYAIFLLQHFDKPKDSTRQMIMADFQSLDRDDGVFYAMLRKALEQCRRSGSHLLVTMGVSASGTDMSGLAPYRRSRPQHSTSLYKARDPVLSNALSATQAWCPTLYDGDMAL